MKRFLFLLRLRLRMLNPRRYQAKKCGHKTKRLGWLRSGEVTEVCFMPLNEEGTVDYCFHCLNKMTIPCGWCGEPILIGDPVTLFAMPDDGIRKPHRGAVIYCTHPFPLLIGCFTKKCGIRMPDIAGYWIPGDDGKGMVLRVKTPLEQMLHNLAPAVQVVENLDKAIEVISQTELEDMPVSSDRLH